MNCPYKQRCENYEYESITCCFLYGLCRQKRHYDIMEMWEEKRDKQRQLEAEMFGLSQEERSSHNIDKENTL